MSAIDLLKGWLKKAKTYSGEPGDVDPKIISSMNRRLKKKPTPGPRVPHLDPMDDSVHMVPEKKVKKGEDISPIARLGDWLEKSGIPSLSAMKRMSWHDHFDHVQHHNAMAESAKSAGHHALADHHAKMADMHHEFRLAGQKRASVSGPYAGAMSSGHRGRQRKEASGHLGRAVALHAELKSSPMNKAQRAPYPQAAASSNIEAHMLRMKKNPKKYPGGAKQAEAIGISQAQRGEKEPKPRKKMGKGNGIPMYRSEETGIDDETSKASSLDRLGDWLEKAMPKAKRKKKMKKDMDVATPTPKTGTSPDPVAIASSMRSAFGGK